VLQTCSYSVINPHQVFLLGINFNERLLAKKALTSLYGISSTSTTCYTRAPASSSNSSKPSPAQHNLLSRLMAQHHVHPTATLGSLQQSQLDGITATLSELVIENDLRRRVIKNINRLRDMGSYRGRRHAMGLPVRGQRTRTQVGVLSVGTDGQDYGTDKGVDYYCEVVE